MQLPQDQDISKPLQIHALPAFDDNYLWLLQIGHRAIVVDPGDADVVQDALQRWQLKLDAILITHHHHDHIGGVEKLYEHYRCAIYAPSQSPIPQPHTPATRNQPPDLRAWGIDCAVLTLPGHTLDHIAYLISDNRHATKHLFSGDVLFSAGCGRLFEGTYAQMLQSLHQIKQLPESTLIYPAHEYTLKNIAFAKQIESDNQALLAYETHCLALRANGQPTLPTALQQELNINPFLRCAQIASIFSTQLGHCTELDAFIHLRQLRNTF